MKFCNFFQNVVINTLLRDGWKKSVGTFLFRKNCTEPVEEWPCYIDIFEMLTSKEKLDIQELHIKLTRLKELGEIYTHPKAKVFELLYEKFQEHKEHKKLKQLMFELLRMKNEEKLREKEAQCLEYFDNEDTKNTADTKRDDFSEVTVKEEENMSTKMDPAIDGTDSGNGEFNSKVTDPTKNVTIVAIENFSDIIQKEKGNIDTKMNRTTEKTDFGKPELKGRPDNNNTVTIDDTIENTCDSDVAVLKKATSETEQNTIANQEVKLDSDKAMIEDSEHRTEYTAGRREVIENKVSEFKAPHSETDDSEQERNETRSEESDDITKHDGNEERMTNTFEKETECRTAHNIENTEDIVSNKTNTEDITGQETKDDAENTKENDEVVELETSEMTNETGDIDNGEKNNGIVDKMDTGHKAVDDIDAGLTESWINIAEDSINVDNSATTDMRNSGKINPNDEVREDDNDACKVEVVIKDSSEDKEDFVMVNYDDVAE